MSPGERVSAAAEVMPALRELFTNLAIDIAETKAKAQTDRELHEREAATLRRSAAEATSQAERLASDLEKGQEERANQLDQLLAARSANDDLSARLKDLEDQLLQANAELDDYRARGVESSGAIGSENARLKQELAAIRTAHDQVEAELAGLREKVRGGEARQAKLREEMNQRLAERDQILAEKARENDRLQAEQADAHALAVKVDAITKELTAAHEQLKQYKQIHGELTGVTAQAGDLKKAMKGKEAERESLQNRIRELEAELADKRGELDEAQSSIQAKLKEMQSLREKKDKEVEAERLALATLRESERKLKEENVGLKARVRRLTEHS
jgi:chromosome segregation ATPase